METEINTTTPTEQYTNTERTAQEIVADQKTELYEEDLIYGVKEPRGNCKHCNGTGREGWDLTTGDPRLCRCLSRQGKGEWMTALSFKRLCETRRPYGEGKRSTNDIRTDQVHNSEDRVESKAEETDQPTDR